MIPLGGFSSGVFRIDHDQALQETAVFRYQRPHNAEWIDFTWRYDSGLVVSGVRDVLAATLLTPNQQVDIGFSCNGMFASLQNPITVCNGIGKSTLLTLPQTGTENDEDAACRDDAHDGKERQETAQNIGPGLALELSGSERFTVFVDHPKGVDHALCERVTEVLRDYLDRYAIDVSSPGTDRPLRRKPHFERVVGRTVKVRTADEIAGRKRFLGELVAAGDRTLRVAAGKDPVEIPYESIVRGNLIEGGTR